jgi:hypothetical protein
MMEKMIRTALLAFLVAAPLAAAAQAGGGLQGGNGQGGGFQGGNGQSGGSQGGNGQGGGFQGGNGSLSATGSCGVTDLAAFGAFIAGRPTVVEFRAAYACVQLVLPGDFTTREMRSDNSRYFAEVDTFGRIAGGHFQ